MKTRRVAKKSGSKSTTLDSPRIQLITPFLWFDKEAEEAAKFYCSIFPNSRITKIVRNGEAGPGPKGSVLTVEFLLNGQEFVALNGGPDFKFTEAISFTINCSTQAQVDRYWKKLTADGGKEVQCGWLKDKYGLFWQVTPTILIKMISDPNPEKANRAMRAMMDMVKIDIAALKKAVAGKA
jgi:predicted 3-demethylubiquinone-9 3-methyltransferase (glyoxalase superfamily)